MTKNTASGSLQIRNERNKPSVFVSKPVKMADNNKGSSLLHNMSIFYFMNP